MARSPFGVLALVCSMLVAGILSAQPDKKTPLTMVRHLTSPRGGLTIRAMSFSPDGRFLAVTGNVTAPGLDEEGVLHFEASTGRIVWHLSSEKRLGSVAYSPDGKFVACGEGQWGGEPGDDKRCGIVLIETRSGTRVRRLDGHTDSVLAVTFTPDGHGIVSGSYDGTMRLWDVATGKEKERLIDHKPRFEGDELRGRIQNVVFSADGKTLAFDHASKLQLFDWKHRPKGSAIEWEGKPRGMVLSPDGNLLAAAAGKIAVFEVTTQRERFSLAEGRRHVSFSHDGRWLATANQNDHCVEVVDTRTGREVHCLKPTITRVDSVKKVHNITGASGPLAFSPTRRVLAACAAGGIVVWNLDKEAD